MKRALLFAILLFVAAPAAALDVDVEPVFVLSTERHEGTPYDLAVALAAPYKGGGHIGIVLNRPLEVTLAELFPEFAPAAKVAEPVYFGGELRSNAIFALVRAQAQPSEQSIPMSPGVWLVEDSPTIDRIIEATPNQARYYIGRLYWRPGTLRGFIDEGKLAAAPADASKLFLPDTSKLYDELAPAGPRPAGARSARLGRI